MISFYIPFSVFPGWDTKSFAVNAAKLGIIKWVWLRLLNSTLTFIPLIAFAYAVTQVLMPGFFFNKRNKIVTLFVFTILLGIIFFAQYFSWLLVAWIVVKINHSRTMPTPDRIFYQVSRIILFAYPIVGGFAVIIKMMKRNWLKQLETQQTLREKANAELQLLKAQIHPHFLFNTLNNIYFFSLTASERAPEMLVKLEGILRYILNECNEPLVLLEKELDLIQDYIALEKIRYGDNLKFELEINGDYADKLISPLLLLPLVENSFKHGSSKMLAEPWITLQINIKDHQLVVLLINSKPDEKIIADNKRRIGLNNVKKRLQLLYPSAHELSITEQATSFKVLLKLNVAIITANTDKQFKSGKYEMA